jgi:hypothetical protein
MKKTTVFSVALLTVCGNAVADSFVTETNDSGIGQAIASCEGHGIFDVFMLSDEAISALKQHENITVNDYRIGKDDNSQLENGGNVHDAEAPADMVMLDDGTDASFHVIKTEPQNWWAALYYKNYAGAARNFSHINANTHIHLVIWTDSQDLCDSQVKIHFNKNDGQDDSAAQIYLCTDAAKTDGNLPTAGSLQAGKWVALDMTYGQIAELMADNGDNPKTLDYSRFASDNPKFVETMGLEPPAQLNGARFGIDGLYFYTPDVESGIADANVENDLIFIGAHTVSTTGSYGIELYSASGLLIEKVADNNISTDNLSKGIYIVKSGKKTMKIAL